MSDYVWKSFYTDPDPAATPDEIATVEAELGVSLPQALRDGYLTDGDASIFKGGKRCSVAVTGPVREGGREVGFFQNLEPLTGIVYQVRGLREYVEDAYEQDLPDVIPFAGLGGGGWVCLNYRNDPTRANPEIWEFDQNGISFEDGFRKVADNFDHLIEMLVNDDTLKEFGFEWRR